MQLSQICRLCLEEKTNNDTVLVEIFSAFVNEPGKEKLNDKIRSLTGLSIVKNDSLPKTICHKCVVSIDSFYEFKNRVLTNDEHLRQYLNLNGTIASDENHEEVDDANVIRLDPNKVYESSDEEENQIETQLDTTNKHKEQQQPEKQSLVIQQKDKKENNNAKRPCNASTRDKMEIFHCKFCDVVFSEIDLCANHENFNHDRNNPFECSLCPFKANQHQHLIIHIKNDHHTEKPFICVVCSKSFLRRSDLRKHIFVHAGIRLFSCNLCSKSFTRAQNLSKHKRTHLESNQKNHKCTLCPKAFVSNSELSRHMEIHMNRNTLNCKYCNQVFTQRDELEIHQQSHIAQIKTAQVQELQSAPPIVFYNQNQQPTENQQSTMNFYKEHVDMQQQSQQSKIEHPIINQLLSNFNNSICKCDKCPEQFPSMQLLKTHQSIFHSKNFVCVICNNAYYKKKELDRHVISAHTDIKFNCSKCSKSFSRKDKLTRHEKTHLNPAFFNCPLCPAVFVRKHLLDLHSKIHTMPNNNYSSIDGSGAMMIINFEEPSLPSTQAQQLPVQVHDTPQQITENFMSNFVAPVKQSSPLDLSPLKVIEKQQEPSTSTSSAFPINLTMNQSLTEPMAIDLSNEKALTNEPPKIILESDDDDDDLKIIEENEEKKDDFMPKTEIKDENSKNIDKSAEINQSQVKEEELIFPMTSRLADLDKMEPSKDLPMEILDI